MRLISALVIVLFFGSAALAQSAGTTNAPQPSSVTSTPSPSFMETYQTAWSTIISAIFGFGGLIIVTHMGLRQSRENQGLQSERDRELQKMQWEENINAEIRQRENDIRSLATVLAAEMAIVEVNLISFIDVADNWIDDCEKSLKASPESKSLLDDYMVTWDAPFLIFKANLDNLGLLPLDIASESILLFERLRRDTNEQKAYYGSVPMLIKTYKNLATDYLPRINALEAKFDALAKGENDEPELPF